MYGQTSLARGKVRVTARVTDPRKPKAGEHSTLVAREGEELSIAEAYRRGIPEKVLEPIGPAGKVAMAAYKDAEGDDGEKARAAEEAARAELRGQAAAAAGADTPDEYPYHDGGGVFVLSNGERVKGREAAEEAEAALHGDG